METKVESLNYLSKSTIVNLKIGQLPKSKKLKKGSVVTDSDESRINASKKLLECKEADTLASEQTTIRRWIYKRALPSPFRAGMLLIPNTLVPQVDAELMAAKPRIEKALEEFLSVYREVIENDKVALRSNWAITDYLTPEQLRDRCAIDWSYLEFVIPGTLPADVIAREQEKARAKFAETTDTIQQVLRAEMAKLVKHAVDKLTPSKENGKSLRFNNTLVSNIREFLDLFNDRNITNDIELDAIVAQARSLLDGVDPQDLRSKEPLRQTVAAGFAEIKTKLDGMLVPAGSRTITFGDEDEDMDAAA